MATVTGFTAARMLAMEAATIVDGDVVGDNLILTRHDGTTFNAGNVRGPIGVMDVGSIIEYISLTPPANWLTMVGQTIVNGQTLYPLLWAVIPASMKSGSSIVMPNTKGKVSVGYDSADTDFDVIGEIGGFKTHVLTQAELPAAPVLIDPPPTFVPIDAPSTAVLGTTGTENTNHIHHEGLAGANYPISGLSGGLVTVMVPRSYSGDQVTDIEAQVHGHPAGGLTVDIAPFNATCDIVPFNSANLGSGTAHSLVQPYVTFLKIIKAL